MGWVLKKKNGELESARKTKRSRIGGRGEKTDESQGDKKKWNDVTEEDNVSEMKWQDIERYRGVKEVRCAAVLETV